MNLLGSAVIAIWNDIAPEGRANFIEWHNREHIPERVGIPGFFRGRRYSGRDCEPEYFTLYEARDTDVLVGEDYLVRLNNPTEWTKRSTAHFSNTSRGVCSTIFSVGTGEGAFMATLRFDAHPLKAGQLKQYLVETVLPPLGKISGICGVHLCVADQAASGVKTAESAGRSIGVPNWIILIEGSWRAEVEAAAGAVLQHDLAAQGCSDTPVCGCYALEFSRVDPTPFHFIQQRTSP